MRRLFLVGGKLLGIFLMYQGLLYAVSALAMANGGAGVALMYALFVLLSLGIGFALAFRTAWVATLLGVEADPQPVSGLAAAEALRTGIVLMGLYVLVTRVGHVVTIASIAATGDVSGSAESLVREIVPILVAFLFVLRSDAVARLIARLSAGSLEPGLR